MTPQDSPACAPVSPLMAAEAVIALGQRIPSAAAIRMVGTGDQRVVGDVDDAAVHGPSQGVEAAAGRLVNSAGVRRTAAS